MKTILFCNLPYAFSILKPLADELEQRGHNYLWYIPATLVHTFPYKSMPFITNIKDLEEFNSDAIFIPGNDMPYWIHGLKVQVFHGLAGEKKGHFRIRDYFDLYLTQGPYFTKKFQALAKKHKNFDVIETGWCKLDTLYTISKETFSTRKALLEQYQVKHIVLYAPTFSPSLTSGHDLVDTIESLSKRADILIIVKFHDKMDIMIKEKYKAIKSKNLIISDEKDITPLLQISDMMISDTSSVVYEFTLLDKPVITLNSTSPNITWENVTNKTEVLPKVLDILNGNDDLKEKREETIKQYHPYNDGRSAVRMLDAVIEYIKEHDVPNKRVLPLLRKWKMRKKYR